MTLSRLSAADEQRLQQLLPWFVNGTLGAEERAWLERLVATYPEAATALACEKNMSAASESLLPVIAQDLGLASLRSRVRADHLSQGKVTLPHQACDTSWWSRVQKWLTTPQWATAMAALVVVQASTIAWLSSSSEEEVSTSRSVGVKEIHTLRVSFRAGTSEAEIRAALVSAGARIVGGPTQIGEYWLASDLTSLDEIRAALLKSNIVASMEVDLAGPRGQ
ncbi:MAG: hypothetical protein ACKOF9_12405 [Burkholderiales bacterium]